MHHPLTLFFTRFVSSSVPFMCMETHYIYICIVSLLSHVKYTYLYRCGSVRFGCFIHENVCTMYTVQCTHLPNQIIFLLIFVQQSNIIWFVVRLFVIYEFILKTSNIITFVELTFSQIVKKIGPKSMKWNTFYTKICWLNIHCTVYTLAYRLSS